MPVPTSYVPQRTSLTRSEVKSQRIFQPGELRASCADPDRLAAGEDSEEATTFVLNAVLRP